MNVNFFQKSIRNSINFDKLVSIIVPVYNRAYCIQKCVDSLLNQSYCNCEIIVVNDGSTDETEEILKKYGKRIIFISQENSGVSCARNKGMEYARGEVLLFCDSDDYVSDTYVEELISIYEPDCLAVSAHSRDMQLLGTPVFHCNLNELSLNQKSGLLMRNFFLQGPCCKLYNKRLIDDNNIRFCEDMNFGEDFKFVLDYLNEVSKINFINIYNYYYNVSVDSLTQSISEIKVKSFVKVNHNFEEFIEKNLSDCDEVKNFYENNIVIDYYGLCVASYKKGYRYGNKNRRIIRESINIKKYAIRKKRINLNVVKRVILRLDNCYLWGVIGILARLRDGKRR